MFKKDLSNWGLYPKIDSKIIEYADFNKLPEAFPKSLFIARGNGRCYGDSSLQKTIVSTLKMSKVLFFDTEKGVIKCESGILLADILKIIVPKGFFLPVTPGTKFITMGGAIASNVHGKNHHKEGAFSDFVHEFEIIDETNKIKRCSKTENQELFANTIGGMGLTGVITTATIELKKIETSYIRQKSIKASNLDELLHHLERYNDYTYSVAWIDCLTKGKAMGRSILMLGEHALKKEMNKKVNNLKIHSSKQLNIPFYFPSYILNTISVSLFNTLYYNKQLKKEVNQLNHYDSFFYPLDQLNNWNRIYGKKGVTQYQFVIPFEKGKEGLHKILKEITDSGCASFLAVLKSFGKKSEYASPLSFPEKGYTLALDFKINDKVFSLLNRLDKIVLKYGGKIYLSKDSRMSKETFHKMYPENIKSHNFLSVQHERLFM